MPVTDQERKTRMGEQGSSTSDVQIDDPRAAHKAGQKAFKELTAPIRGSMALAQLLGVLYGALAVAPYVILVQLGEVLLAAARSGVSPERGEVINLLMWLIWHALWDLFCRLERHSFRGRAFRSSCPHAYGESSRFSTPCVVHLDELGGCTQGDPRRHPRCSYGHRPCAS